jgi:hypothetical protein
MQNNRMEPASDTYLYTIATLSTTFGIDHDFAAGRPLPPNAALHAADLTTALFVSVLGYLHALGNVRPTDNR